jgi:uncharacterized lipoprotein YbaY
MLSPLAESLWMDEGYWLAHCEGFAVVRDDDRPVGVVAYLRYASSHEHPDELAVVGGVFSKRRFAVPASSVRGIDPRTETVTIAADSVADRPARWGWLAAAKRTPARARARFH